MSSHLRDLTHHIDLLPPDPMCLLSDVQPQGSEAGCYHCSGARTPQSSGMRRSNSAWAGQVTPTGMAEHQRHLALSIVHIVVLIIIFITVASVALALGLQAG